MGKQFTKSNEVSASWSLLEPLLAAKKRGEELLHSEVQVASGGVSPRRVATRIRRYFRRAGVMLIAIPGRGWKLATSEEQIRHVAPSHARRALRETKLELLAAGSVADADLTPEARRLRDLHMRRAGGQIAADKQAESERKAILGAPPPRPRLVE